MTDEELTQAMAELQEVVRCHCDEAFRDRGLQDPQCQCDSAEAVKVVADRIEALEAKLSTCEKYRDAYAEMGRIGTQAVRDLEAKLAKAVEALDMLVRDCEADYPPSHVAIKYFAIGALAEIKGESHE